MIVKYTCYNSKRETLNISELSISLKYKLQATAQYIRSFSYDKKLLKEAFLKNWIWKTLFHLTLYLPAVK